jgi:ferritin-like metal-binding protein YciE
MLGIEQELAEDVLPKLSERAHAPDLRSGFRRHLVETQEDVTTVRDILRDLGVPADPEESPGFHGVVEEHRQVVGRIADDDPLLADLADAVAAVTTEHLEVAAYESLVSLAESLGEEEVGIRLREVMEQEELALERGGARTAKLLAEKVESERL